MKVRMVDVARKLGLSKATVSLAVNGKPGVSEETRAQVLACMKEMEEATEAASLSGVSAAEVSSLSGMSAAAANRFSAMSGGMSSAAAQDAVSGRLSGMSMGTGSTSDSGQAASGNGGFSLSGSASGPAYTLLQSQVQQPAVPGSRGLIKVLIINHNRQVVQDPELDLWSEVLTAFDLKARQMGYLYSLSYMGDLPGEADSCIEECNQDFVSGVLLFATEMDVTDYPLLPRIRKPMVIYDYELPDGRISCVCADNYGAVEQGLRLLHEQGASHILYMSTDKRIYNFEKRRTSFDRFVRFCAAGQDPCGPADSGDFTDEPPTGAAFADGPADPHRSVPGLCGKRIALGSNIPEITRNARQWLSSHPLPDAFLFENYQVSIGMTAALRDLGSPEALNVPMVGIDLVPEYMLSGLALSQIRIPHARRAVLAMEQLDREIRDPEAIRVKIFASTALRNAEATNH